MAKFDKSFSELGVYSGYKWQKVRKVALARDSELCQCCLKYGLITPATMVHHIHPITLDNYNDPSVVYNLDNLVSLCDECHDQIHNHIQHARYKLDDDGEIIDCTDNDGVDFYKNFIK